MISYEIYRHFVLKIKKLDEKKLFLRKRKNSRRRDLPACPSSSGVQPSIYFNRQKWKRC